MYVLVEYNNIYKENLEECKNYSLIPIVLFKLDLNGKQNIKTQLEQIKKDKQTIKPKYSAIQITISKLENSSVGTINHLKQDFDLIIGLGGLNKINRFFLEDTQIDFLQDPQNSRFRNKVDFIHHFNSGINHVLCQFAKAKNIGFIFSLNFTKGYEKNITKEIGRINQNLKFARKYNIPIHLNFIIQSPLQIKPVSQIKAFGELFDISTEQKKQIELSLENRIKENTFKNTSSYISRGIEVI